MKKFSLTKVMIPAFAAALSAVLLFASACAPGCGIYLSTLDWAVDLIDAYYYYDVSEEDVRAAGLENLCGNVLDIYSQYYSAEEYRATVASNEGSRSGIGISYTYISPSYGSSLGSGVYIASVLGNSPASQSGLRPGTFVLGGVTAEGERVSFADSADFSSFISDRADGENFTLVTDRGQFTMSKEEYTQSYCRMATAEGEWTISYSSSGSMSVDYAQSSRYSYLPEGAAYISLSQFYGNASDEMAALISRFNSSGCTSLILDLRNNGGGYVAVMQQLAHLFTADLPSRQSAAMYAEYKNSDEMEAFYIDSFTDDSSCYLPAGTPVTVLANSSTASASEALIGVLVSNGVADYSDIYLSDFSQAYLDATGTALKNCRSYGKGIMQRTWEYWVTGEALKLTVAKIYWPDGITSIHDVGLTEEAGCRTSPAEWSVTYDDGELQAVVAELSALGEAA